MDVQTFLNPISESDPVGKYLQWEPEYDEIEEARRADDETAVDDAWRRDFKRADWGKVIEVGTRMLTEKSKDLQVAAFMTQAWSHLRGLPGIRDGLELMRAIQDAFWEKAHPAMTDPELRRGVYEFLDDPKLLPLRIRGIAVTRVDGAPELSFSYLKYEESRDTDRRYQKARNESERSLLEGYLRGETFDEAAAQTARPFYVGLMEELRACREAVERLNDDLKQRWPVVGRERPPQLSLVLSALDDVEGLAKKLLARKPAPEPVAAPPVEDEPPPDPEEAIEPSGDEASVETTVEEPAPRPSRPTQSQRPRKAAVELNTAEDAVARIVEAAHFLRRADPADPSAYLVLRALNAGGLYRDSDALGSGDLPAPPTEVRQRLFQLSKNADGDQWAGLLDESERAMGGAEGRGWLDPHYYSARALEAQGFEAAARACKASLASCLRDHDRWPESYLRDGTPCASGPTRDWIEREARRTTPPAAQDAAGRPSHPIELASAGNGSVPAVDSPDGEAEDPDPWEAAQALFRSGRRNEAISAMVRAVRQARTGRERFLRTLQQAELCLGSDRPGLALPLLEMLAQRIDDLRLDQWEDSSLCARVLAHLYRCLRARDEPRAAAIYNRLCQLDAGEALLLGET